MSVNRQQAMRVAMAHLIRGVNEDDVREGWPAGAYRVSDEPVWSVPIPDRGQGVVGTRFIVISQVNGRVLADRRFSE